MIWINFQPSMDKYLHQYKVSGEIDYAFSNFKGAALEVWEWRNNFILHLTGMWLIIRPGI